MCKDDLALRKKFEIEFCKHQVKFQKSRRRAKRKFFGEYLSGIDPRNPFGPHFDWIKGKTNNNLKLSCLVKEDGTTTANFTGTVEHLMAYHFSKEVGWLVGCFFMAQDPERTYCARQRLQVIILFLFFKTCFSTPE